MSLRLAHRRLVDYINEEAFVHPEDLCWIAEQLGEITERVDPWQERYVYAGRHRSGAS